MKNSFQRNQELEVRSQNVLLPILLEAFNGQIVSTASGSMSIELQKTAGDFLAQRGGFSRFQNDVIGLELKAEEKHTGNLFIETWSNKERWNPGWVFTSLADYILYHFLDVQVCYVLSMRKLKQFCFTDKSSHGMPGKLFDYEERKQKKHDQLNDTWGRLIPVGDLEQCCCLRKFWTNEDGLLFKF